MVVTFTGVDTTDTGGSGAIGAPGANANPGFPGMMADIVRQLLECTALTFPR